MNAGPSCENCPVHHVENLVRLGIAMDRVDYVVALAGNPNTGKSTVFNNLTGLRQHTGNWPGKTVVRAEGGFSYKEKRYKVVDLPGTYSLLSTSTDEEVARDFILFGRPDVTVIVADATRLDVWAFGVTVLCCALRHTTLGTDPVLQDEATAVLARDLARDDDVHRRSIRFSPSSEPRLRKDSVVWKAIGGALRLGRARMSMADISTLL